VTKFLGMVPEEVKQLSSQLGQRAGEIRQLASTLTSAIQSAHWVGPDRERFVSEWTSQHVPQLNTISEALENASQVAMQNAVQEEVSAR
jgi:uncharacterized protein YukE